MAKNHHKIKRIKHIENHLRKYNTYKAGVEALKLQLDYIMPELTVNYSSGGGGNGTFNIQSETEKYAIDRIESSRALEIHENMERYNVIIKSIDEAMKDLDSIEKEFIKKRYFEGMTIPKTAIELGYSEKYVFNIRNQIFEKLLISLKGLLFF